MNNTKGVKVDFCSVCVCVRNNRRIVESKNKTKQKKIKNQNETWRIEDKQKQKNCAATWKTN